MKSKLKKSLGYLFLVIAITIVAGILYLRFFLPDVEAAPYLSIEATPERIERGRYLANHVTGCMDCHSTRDWSRYSAPIVEGTLGKGGEYFGPEMGFPGKFYSRNLTPANLGDWTDGEIFRAITTGVNREGKALFPVMPYSFYRKMDREDIYAIIAYLRTLPARPSEFPESEPDFPMNLIMNTIPQEPSLVTIPDPSDQVRYGAYLTNAASCMECHTPAEKGELVLEKAFAGGREFKMPAGVLRSANITPDKATGIGAWSEADFLARFKAFQHPEAAKKLKEGQMNTIMPWTLFAGMTEADLKAIYSYLRTIEPVENKVKVWM